MSSDSDDFEIVSCTDSIKWFYPIDKAWQRAQCQKLRLTLKVELDFKVSDPIPAEPPMETHEIEGDGNCYFRCLSYLITGTDKSHRTIRNKLVKFMKENEKLVEGLGGESYMKQAMMWIDGTWPTEVEIYASACMLDTDIYTYMDGKWLRFSSSGKLELRNGVDRAIYLRNVENVHYDVVVQVRDPKLLPPNRVYSARSRRARRRLSPTSPSLPIVHSPAVTLDVTEDAESHTLEFPSFGPKKRLKLEPFPTETMDEIAFLKKELNF